jgi:hypothetical protein
LDGDGDKDVVGTAQGSDEVSWWRNDGGNPINWAKFVIDDNFNQVWPGYACDLDGDRDIDILAGSGWAGTNEVKWWENIESPAGIEDNSTLRIPLTNLTLQQNYPNPFNPYTTITFEIPDFVTTDIRGNPIAKQSVNLSIYDIRGQRVKTLIDTELGPGGYQINWDGRNDLDQPVASGIYFYTLKTGGERFTRKMTVMK